MVGVCKIHAARFTEIQVSWEIVECGKWNGFYESGVFLSLHQVLLLLLSFCPSLFQKFQDVYSVTENIIKWWCDSHVSLAHDFLLLLVSYTLSRKTSMIRDSFAFHSPSPLD